MMLFKGLLFSNKFRIYWEQKLVEIFKNKTRVVL